MDKDRTKPLCCKLVGISLSLSFSFRPRFMRLRDFLPPKELAARREARGLACMLRRVYHLLSALTGRKKRNNIASSVCERLNECKSWALLHERRAHEHQSASVRATSREKIRRG